MGEFFSATIDNLLDDLLLGQVSYWQKWGVAGRVGGSVNNYYVVDPTAGPSFSFAPGVAQMALLFPYVRQGARRVAATGGVMKVVAFENTNGKRMVFAKRTPANPTASVTITGLAPGVYGVKRTPAGSSGIITDPDVTVGANGWAVLPIAPGYTAVYAK